VRARFHDAASSEGRAGLARLAAEPPQLSLHGSVWRSAGAPITDRTAHNPALCGELSDFHFCSECAQSGQFKRIIVISFWWQAASLICTPKGRQVVTISCGTRVWWATHRRTKETDGVMNFRKPFEPPETSTIELDGDIRDLSRGGAIFRQDENAIAKSV
jgi:hypothetical protein